MEVRHGGGWVGEGRAECVERCCNCTRGLGVDVGGKLISSCGGGGGGEGVIV